jgi:hypothetical protein
MPGIDPELPALSRIDDARARLSLARLRTRRSVAVLRTEVQVRSDWQAWYQARPVPFLAAAFFVGFLLAKRR